MATLTNKPLYVEPLLPLVTQILVQITLFELQDWAPYDRLNVLGDEGKNILCVLKFILIVGLKMVL